MTGRHPIAAIAVLASLALVVGCGGGDDGATAGNGGQGSTSEEGTTSATQERSTAGVSKQEFIDQANALCAKDSAETKIKSRKIFKEVFKKPQAVAAERMVEGAILPGFEGELEDLKTLNVPEDGGNEVKAFYIALEKMLAELRKNPEAQNFYPYTEAEDLATKAGLTSCGHP